jgi:uncharacterized protein
MEMVTLPRTGLALSALGMGTVPIAAGRVAEDERVPILRAVYDMGINWFDTARNYGPAEDALGEAFHGMRDRVVIISKSSAMQPEALQAQMHETLRLLRSDYVDVYMFHSAYAVRQECFLTPGGLLDIVTRAREAGKVRFLGFSAHSFELALEALDTAAFDFAMVPANLISTQYIEGAFLDRARARGVTVLAMKPYGGGRIENPRMCLKYLRQFPDVLPCVGIESAAQMAENLRIWDEGQGSLTADDLGEIERIRATLGDRFCRQCGYCLPCPQGVPIIMANLMEVWAKQMSPQVLKQYMSWIVPAARRCIECRECVARCPYDLPIPEMLRESIALFDRTVAA